MAQVIKGGLVGPTSAQSLRAGMENFGTSMGRFGASMEGLHNRREVAETRRDEQKQLWLDEFRKELVTNYGGDITSLAHEDMNKTFDYFLMVNNGNYDIARNESFRVLNGQLTQEEYNTKAGADQVSGVSNQLGGVGQGDFTVSGEDPSIKYRTASPARLPLPSDMEAIEGETAYEQIYGKQKGLDNARQRFFDDVQGLTKPPASQAPVSAQAPQSGYTPASTYSAPPSSTMGLDPEVRALLQTTGGNVEWAKQLVDARRAQSATPVMAEGSTIPGMERYDQATGGQDSHHLAAVGDGEGIINVYAMGQPGVQELVQSLNEQYPNPAAQLAPESVPSFAEGYTPVSFDDLKERYSDEEKKYDWGESLKGMGQALGGIGELAGGGSSSGQMFGGRVYGPHAQNHQAPPVMAEGTQTQPKQQTFTAEEWEAIQVQEMVEYQKKQQAQNIEADRRNYMGAMPPLKQSQLGYSQGPPVMAEGSTKSEQEPKLDPHGLLKYDQSFVPVTAPEGVPRGQNIGEIYARMTESDRRMAEFELRNPNFKDALQPQAPDEGVTPEYLTALGRYRDLTAERRAIRDYGMDIDSPTARARFKVVDQLKAIPQEEWPLAVPVNAGGRANQQASGESSMTEEKRIASIMKFQEMSQKTQDPEVLKMIGQNLIGLGYPMPGGQQPPMQPNSGMPVMAGGQVPVYESGFDGSLPQDRSSSATSYYDADGNYTGPSANPDWEMIPSGDIDLNTMELKLDDKGNTDVSYRGGEYYVYVKRKPVEADIPPMHPPAPFPMGDQNTPTENEADLQDRAEGDYTSRKLANPEAHPGVTSATSLLLEHGNEPDPNNLDDTQIVKNIGILPEGVGGRSEDEIITDPNPTVEDDVVEDEKKNGGKKKSEPISSGKAAQIRSWMSNRPTIGTFNNESAANFMNAFYPDGMDILDFMGDIYKAEELRQGRETLTQAASRSGIDMERLQLARDAQAESIRQFNESLQFDRDKFNSDNAYNDALLSIKQAAAEADPAVMQNLYDLKGHYDDQLSAYTDQEGGNVDLGIRAFVVNLKETGQLNAYEDMMKQILTLNGLAPDFSLSDLPTGETQESWFKKLTTAVTNIVGITNGADTPEAALERAREEAQGGSPATEDLRFSTPSPNRSTVTPQTNIDWLNSSTDFGNY